MFMLEILFKKSVAECHILRASADFVQLLRLVYRTCRQKHILIVLVTKFSGSQCLRDSGF